MATKVIKARTSASAKLAARHGAKALRAGRLVAFATETVYGVAAMATDAEAMDRLRELKSRPKQPFSVHLGRPEDAARYLAEPPAGAKRLMAKAWPGPLTIILPTGGRLADSHLEKAGLHDVLAAGGLIGLRCPDEPVACAMLSAVAAPVVASSANRAGGASPRCAADVLKAFDGKIDMLIDSGPTRHGKDSTIIRFDGGDFKILRRGVLGVRQIRGLLKWRLLIVCTGNTCRSAMAEGLARKLLADELGCSVGGLRKKDVEVVSAGVLAAEGHKATAEAVEAAGRLGADISAHRSQRLTGEMIRLADLVLCMKDSHVENVLKLVPSAAAKTSRLDPRGDIEDPLGAGAEFYHTTARRIRQALRPHLRKALTR